MSIKEWGTRLTLRELLAERGFVINMDAFKGPPMGSRTCDPSYCTHGTGSLPVASIVEAALDRTDFAEDCFYLKDNQLVAFRQLCFSFFQAHTNPAYILDIRAFDWWIQWNDYLLGRHTSMNLRDANSTWVRTKIAANKDSLHDLYLEHLEHLERERGSALPPASLGAVESFVLVRAFHGGAFATGHGLCREYYGPSGIPGVLLVPARFIHSLPFSEARRTSRTCSLMGQEHHFAPDGRVWFLGENACEQPVEVLDSYTAKVRETAAGLMESLTLKEALDAAAEI